MRNRIGRAAAALVLAAILALAFSCATTDINALDKHGNPIWTSEIPVGLGVFYGVGNAKFSNADNSREAADANARADLAKKISVTMKEFVSQYKTEATDADAFEKLTVQIVDLTLKQVKVERRWLSPEGKAWTLVSIKTKNLAECYDHAQENLERRLEAQKAEVDARLAQALEGIAADEKKEKEAEEKEKTGIDWDGLKTAAKAAAAAMTGDLDKMLGSLGKLGSSSDLGGYLASLGL